MSNFSYEVINEAGKTISGVISADSVDKAEEKLTEQGYIPIKISPEGADSIFGKLSELDIFKPKVKTTDLILFTKQFRTMYRAGIPLLSIVTILEKQTEDPTLKKALISININIRKGATLCDCLKEFPDIFSSLYCCMVEAGEISGSLPEVLERLTYILEHEYKIKADIKAAVQYPKMIMYTLFAAFMILLTFVIPKFVKVFEKAGLDLPLPTKIALFMYNFLINYWYFMLGGIILTVILLKRYLKTKKGMLMRDTLMLKLPVMGKLFIKAAMSRFSSIFAILHASGIPVLDTIEIVSGTIGNAAISNEFDRIKGKLEQGQGISVPLQSAKFFTPMVNNMIAVGEESGNLDEMLREVSVHYDDEVDYEVKYLSESLTPFLIVALTAVVGFFALAIFLPMWDLTKMVK